MEKLNKSDNMTLHRIILTDNLRKYFSCANNVIDYEQTLR